jgi:hypothetical protein
MGYTQVELETSFAPFTTKAAVSFVSVHGRKEPSPAERVE